jgi:predicted nucleic-acid-binding protein
MNAVDTNVVVRFLTRDDPNQAAEARSVFDAGPIWIAKTVFLETEWVLRKLYGLKPDAILDNFTRLLGLRNVLVEDEPSVRAALALASQGIDLADAMHLSSRPPGAPFLTFDRALVRAAKRAGVSGVSGLPGNH